MAKIVEPVAPSCPYHHKEMVIVKSLGPFVKLYTCLVLECGHQEYIELCNLRK